MSEPQTPTKPSVHSDFNWLNPMKAEVHTLAIEKGWHDQPETDEQYIMRSVANFHGEASELWEAFRNRTLVGPCDKADQMASAGLEALTSEEEELADLIIRVLDYSARRSVDIGRAVRLKHEFNKTRPRRHGGKAA